MTEQNILEPQISADGHWRWDGSTWVPNHPHATTPQPPAAPPAPPKKKMGPGKKMLIGFGAVVLIATAMSMGGNDGTDATTPTSGSSSEQGDSAKQKNAKADSSKTNSTEKAAAPAPDNTTATANGPLVWGNWETVGPVEPKKNVLDMFDLTIRVTNTGDGPDQGLFTATVLKQDRILGTFDCISADEITPGAVTTVSCITADDFVAGWDEITIEDSF